VNADDAQPGGCDRQRRKRERSRSHSQEGLPRRLRDDSNEQSAAAIVIVGGTWFKNPRTMIPRKLRSSC